MLIKRALVLRDASIIDRDMLLFGPKKASFIKHDISENLVHAQKPIDIVAELKEKNPEEWVFFRARAIDAGGSDLTGETFYGPNDNGDYFSEEELLKEAENGEKAFETFIGCSIFTNHKNDDIEQARGKIVNAFYDLKNHCVYVDAMVDAKAYPQLARGILQNYISDCSMGTAVKYSTCSICGNKAASENQFCEHVKNHKGKMINGKKVYEKNVGCKFIELSAVTDGACPNCTIQQAYTGPELLAKLKETVEKGNSCLCNLKESCEINYDLLKVASKGQKDNSQTADYIDVLIKTFNNSIITAQLKDNYKTAMKADTEVLEQDRETLLQSFKSNIVESIKTLVNTRKVASLSKTASGEDIDNLNQSLDLLKQVAANILSSKDVDFDFLEDIGELLSKLQMLIVDLVEAGFANQQTNVEQEENEETPAAPQEPAPVENEQMPSEMAGFDAQNPLPQPQQPAANPVPQTPAPMPMTASNKKIVKKAQIEEEIKGISDFSKELKTLVDNIQIEETDMALSKKEKSRKTAMSKISDKFAQLLDEQIMNNEPVVVADGLFSVTIDPQKGIDGYVGNKKVASLNIDSLDEELQASMKISPQVTAGRIIQTLSDAYNENGEIKMADSKNVREALVKSIPPVEKVMEGQLEDLNGNFSRKNAPVKAEGQVGVTTEAQLESVGKSPETGKGDFERVRPDGVKENLEVMEGQLDDSRPTDFGVARDAKTDLPVMEGQLAETGFGSERWQNDRANSDLPIMEGQFEGKDRTGVAENEVMEGQIDAKRFGSVADRVISAFLNGFANTVINQKISPKTIASVKISADSIKKAKKSAIVKKAQLAAEEVKAIVENAVIDEIGVNMDLATPYIDDTIEAMYEDSDILIEQIEATANAKIDELKKIATKKDDQIVEQKTVSAVKAAWGKKTAGIDSGILKITADDNLKRYLVDFTDNKQPVEIKYAEVANFFPGVILANVDENRKEEAVKEILKRQGTENPEIHPDGLAASIVEKLQKLAETKMGKTAQNPNGTTLPAPGGMTNAPAAPAGDGLTDLGGAPEPDPAADIAGDFGDEEETEGGSGEAFPFGAHCPSCDSNNVDAMNGKFKCNDCELEYALEINIKVLNPEILSDVKIGNDSEPESEGADINDQLAEPAEAPAEAPAAPAPGAMAAAKSWIKDAPLRITASVDPQMFFNQGRELKRGTPAPFGLHCPQCGGVKVAMKDSDGTCLDCGCKNHVCAIHNGPKVDVEMTFEPNLTLADTKQRSGGYAVTAECENCDEIKDALHTIMSSKIELVKIARANQENNPMLSCMSDQMANGYADEDAMNICASIKTFVLMKEGLLDDGTGEAKKEEADTDTEDEPKDKAPFEKKDEEDDKKDDEIVDLDDKPEIDEVEDIEDEVEDPDLVELEDDEPSEEDAVEFETEDKDNPEPKNIEKVIIQGTDAQGEDFEVEVKTNGVDLGNDDFDAETEETEVKEEIFTPEDELAVEKTDQIGDGGIVEDEVKENEGKDIMSTLFSDGLPKEEVKEEVDPDSVNGEFAITASSMMRGSTVKSSDKNVGGNLDISKLAQALNMTMPNDTEVEVPRDEEVGIVEDGIVATETDVKNTAKKIHGNAAGSTIADEDILAGSDRGVEVIAPKKAKKVEIKLVKKAQMADFANEPEIDLSGAEDLGEAETDMVDAATEEVAAKNGISVDELQRIIEEAKSNMLTDEPIGEEPDVETFETHEDLACDHSNLAMASKPYNMRKAQKAQIEPVDAVQEEDTINIPRSEAKAKPETGSITKDRPDVAKPTEVRTKDYVKGKGAENLHSDVVPRSDGNGGLEGKKKVEFDVEESNAATSGNPDTYVQSNQETIKPTPAGSEENHAVAKSNAIKKVASAKNIKVANLEATIVDNSAIVMDMETGKIYKVKI